MKRAATEVLFLPGFDGDGALREPFLKALAQHPHARAITYPNYRLRSLDGYCRFAAAQVEPHMATVLIAESFSGLVAARWAAHDPQVAGVVLCGAFARNPVTWGASLAASMPAVVKFGAGFLRPPLGNRDPMRLQWSKALSQAVRGLDDAVIGERLRLIADEDVRAELAALRMPVALLQFDGDLVIGPRARRELEEVCHNAHVVRLPGPHFAIETMPSECAAAIGPLLRTMTKTGASSGSP